MIDATISAERMGEIQSYVTLSAVNVKGRNHLLIVILIIIDCHLPQRQIRLFPKISHLFSAYVN